MNTISTNMNDFDMLDKIGTGTYSTVYSARHKINQNYVAVKTVPIQSLSKLSTDNLLTEIKLLKTLHHKHIVEMFDFRWDRKNIYIIMELCNAGNLSMYIMRHHKLPEATCKFFLRQLSLALQYMRENNVSHFDLKPQNLLLIRSPNITLKVADFGFAQHLNLDEENTVIKGSPLYMAPEILLKQCYDPSADLWSIGVILYECLFGHAPYSSKTVEELLMKVQAQQKILIDRTSTIISADCYDILVKLLVHEPKDRIKFSDYFNHPFLDLKHAPTEENFEKAIEVVTKAINCDKSGDFEAAYYLYCDALLYFVPIIIAELDMMKKNKLKQQVKKYIERAEYLKNNMILNHHKNINDGATNVIDLATSYPSSSSTKPSITIPKTISASLTATTITSAKKMDTLIQNNPNMIQEFPRKIIKSTITPNATFNLLYNLCTSNQNLQNALDIGRHGEIYAYENNLTISLEWFTRALGILVPLLTSEPSGQRKDLLHKQILLWMKEAESIKSLLDAHNLENDTTTPNTQNTTNQCCVQ